MTVLISYHSHDGSVRQERLFSLTFGVICHCLHISIAVRIK